MGGGTTNSQKKKLQGHMGLTLCKGVIVTAIAAMSYTDIVKLSLDYQQQ